MAAFVSVGAAPTLARASPTSSQLIELRMAELSTSDEGTLKDRGSAHGHKCHYGHYYLQAQMS